MTSHFTLDISQSDMINLFDNCDLNIREYRKEGKDFYIEIRHNEETDGKELVNKQLAMLKIKATVNDYQIPELCKRYW